MGGIRYVVTCLIVTGCLPRPQPAEPVPPQPTLQPQPQPQPQVQVQVQPQPLPQPYPTPQPYAPAPQTYAPAQPYPAPVAYPTPAPLPAPAAGKSHFHDGEVIVDFASVGALAATDLMVRQDLGGSQVDSFVLLAGVGGGGALGWLLTDKFPVDGGAAHATTLGLMLGIANGALLVEPTQYSNASSILGLLLVGGAAGAGGGFAYGQVADLTPGQATFVANMTLLGSATAALGAITGSQDGKFGGWEDGSLAIGLDGGAIAGAAIAPSLDWSPRRAKVVFASTVIGSFAGGMLAALVSKPNTDSTSSSGDIVAASMTAGMWGGFGLGIMMTKDDPPDPRFKQPQPATTTASRPATSPTSIVPWLGDRGQLGVMAGGAF